MGLSGWQVLGVFVGLPALVFVVIALLVLRVAPRRADAFPVLRLGVPTPADARPDAARDEAHEAPSPPVPPEPEHLEPAAGGREHRATEASPEAGPGTADRPAGCHDLQQQRGLTH